VRVAGSAPEPADAVAGYAVDPGAVDLGSQRHPAPADDPATDAVDADDPAAPTVRRKGRRVTTEPVAGTDPTPTPEPSRSSGTENDARLKADKPPHWG